MKKNNNMDAISTVKLLNNMLSRCKVEGFRYELSNYGEILLMVKKRNDVDLSNSLDIFSTEDYVQVDLFSWKSLHDIFSREKADTHDSVLTLIKKYKNTKVRSFYKGDYNSINENGIMFLKCISESKSLEELELKLAILGY